MSVDECKGKWGMLRDCAAAVFSVTDRAPALFPMTAAGTAARTWQSLIHCFDGSLLFPWLRALPTLHRGAFFGLRSRRRRLRHQPSLWALHSECSAQWKGQGSLFCRMLLKPCLPQGRLPQPIILSQTRVNSILEIQVCHSKTLWFMVNSLLPMTVISIPPLPEPTDFLGQRERSEKEAAFFLSERARYLY